MVWVTSLSNLCNLMSLYPYLRWENPLCLKCRTTKKKKEKKKAVVSHNIFSPLGKKTQNQTPKHFMAKYEYFVLKRSDKLCVWEY